jgi:predicted metal-dependent peptidase
VADAPGPRASGQHEHRGVAAVQRMVEYAPSSGGLALWVGHRDVDDDEAARLCPRTLGLGGAPLPPAPAFTDGRTVFYAPAFDDLTVEEQAGWVAHQVLHIALRHAPRCVELRQRIGDVDDALFNLCADAIVNSALAHLRWLRLPRTALRLEDVLAQVMSIDRTPEAALLEWDVERLYRAVDDRRAVRGGRDAQRRGGASASRADADADRGSARPRADGPRAARLRQLGAGTARDLHPAADADGTPEAEAEAARDWGERLLRAHAGDGPHSMLRALLADLPRVRTPWEQVLRAQMAHALAQKPGPSWSRPTRSYLANGGRTAGGRRLPWEPGTTSTQAVPKVVVVVDVSGSIDDALLARFAAEVEALVRRLEAALVVVIGDERVHEVRRFEPGRGRLEGLALPGQGGTDFTPLLAEAARHRPDLIVVLTDLDGPAKEPPRCPVLWAVPESFAHARAPFGRVLALD